MQEGESRNGVMPFPRVSCAAESAENADLDPQAAGIFQSSSLLSCRPFRIFAWLNRVSTTVI